MNWKSCCLTSSNGKQSAVSIAFNTATVTSLGNLHLLMHVFNQHFRLQSCHCLHMPLPLLQSQVVAYQTDCQQCTSAKTVNTGSYKL